MRLYRGFDPSAVYIRQGGQYYSVDGARHLQDASGRLRPQADVQGLGGGTVKVPPEMVAHAREIRDYLDANDFNDVRIEITAKSVKVQRVEELESRRFR